MNKLIFGVVLLLFSAGCAHVQDRNIYEDSKMQTYLPYSDLARESHLSLNNDGYIIGIEKRDRESLRGIPERYYPDRFALVTEPNEDSQIEKLIHERNNNFKKCTKYDTAMLVTHIVRYFDEPGNKNFNTFRRPYFLYNAYDVYKKDNLNYENGYEALKGLKTELFNDLKQKTGDTAKKSPYSHIIIFSMGWNNNQQESIYRYNRILDNVKRVIRENTPVDCFEPLAIGFTWPSVWFGIEDSWVKKKYGIPF